MTEMITYFIGKLGLFFSWLGSLVIVEGVTILSFLGAIFLIFMLIRNLLLRGK